MLINVDGRKVVVDTLVADANECNLVVMNLEHHKIHAGVHYTVSDYDSDVDNAGPKYWHIKTPNTAVRFHLVFCVTTSGPALVEFFENPTTSADGTGLTAYNNDRTSDNTSTLSVYYDPTVSPDGTRIGVSFIGSEGAAPVGSAGGMLERCHEMIPKQNEQYLVKVTVSNDNTKVAFTLNWYED